jgi:hypothetical protein
MLECPIPVAPAFVKTTANKPVFAKTTADKPVFGGNSINNVSAANEFSFSGFKKAEIRSRV